MSILRPEDIAPDPGFELNVVEEKPTVAKAVIAGVTTLSGTLIVALADNGITATEWVTIAAATVVAVAGVWATSNKP